MTAHQLLLDSSRPPSEPSLDLALETGGAAWVVGRVLDGELWAVSWVLILPPPTAGLQDLDHTPLSIHCSLLFVK